MATTRYPSEFTATPSTDYLEIKMIRRDYTSSTPNYTLEGDLPSGVPDTLILNVPQRITEAFSQKWANVTMGEVGPFLGGRSSNGLGSVAGPAGLGNTIKRMIENFLLKGAVENFAKLGASGLNENGILSATSGVVYNPNLEVLYDGPDFRRFNFQFSLFTKSEKDAQAIYSIVRFFQYSSVPITSGDQGFPGVAGGAAGALVDSAAVTAAEAVANTASQGVQDAINGVSPATKGNNANPLSNLTNLLDPATYANTVQTAIQGTANTIGSYLGAGVGTAVFSSGAESRFIKQPPFLLLTYKRGAELHPFIHPLMPCSLNSLDINYTPTGNYTVMDNYGKTSQATVVGVTITIGLTEVKAVYRGDLQNNYANRAPGVS